ncbi:MAG TPA: PGPGW domain-containing protein [Candidatus Nitrosopolaris sp.]|nr:PGPGW domain-containing protein [Candidatus Nitrosopolaris sp.]
MHAPPGRDNMAGGLGTLTVVRPHSKNRAVLPQTARATRVAVGIVLLVIGGILALPLVPGPGVLVMFGGLTVLSNEFAWARRLRERLLGMLPHLGKGTSDGG